MVPVLWKPARIDAKDGLVLIDGPSGLTLSITPDAAREISDRIAMAAMKAELQPKQSGQEPIES